MTVESVCDALSDGHAIDLRRRSPLWPDLDWKNKHTYTHAQTKARLRPPYVTSAGEISLSLTRLQPPLTDTSSALQWDPWHLKWSGSRRIHSLVGSSPAVKGELASRVVKLKPVHTLRHTICHMASYFKFRGQCEHESWLFLSGSLTGGLLSLLLPALLLALGFFFSTFLTFLSILIVQGFKRLYFSLLLPLLHH